MSAFILYPDPLGATIEHQSGGYACNSQELVGTAFPLNSEKYEEKLYAYFYDGPHQGWCCTPSMNEDDAQFVDAVIQEGYVAGVLAEGLREGFVIDEKDVKPNYRVDRSRLDLSEEAFVYMLDSEDKSCMLIWGNSD